MKIYVYYFVNISVKFVIVLRICVIAEYNCYLDVLLMVNVYIN